MYAKQINNKPYYVCQQGNQNVQDLKQQTIKQWDTRRQSTVQSNYNFTNAWYLACFTVEKVIITRESTCSHDSQTRVISARVCFMRGERIAVFQAHDFKYSWKECRYLTFVP